MSSRYPPAERSPSRLERRGSLPYGASRNPDAPHRSNEPHSYSSTPRELTREPPIGPKASRDGGRGGSFAPRGRPYGTRGDSRDVQFGRRESERDWRNRDTYDRRASPVNRARSRSPAPRDFRDNRDFATGRDLDISRTTRGIRDGPPSATSTTSDSPYSGIGAHGRGGGYRGRGRGDFDARGRGKGAFTEDRETFRQRSRSRDRTWDRDFREDRTRAYERDTSKLDEDKRTEWDEESDRRRRDPPMRSESRNSGGSHTNPSTPLSAVPSTGQTNSERPKEGTKHPPLISDGSRRSSFATSHPDQKPRDDPRQYQSPVRHDFSRASTHQQVPSSPPQPTPVPAFGSIAARVNVTGLSPSSAQPNSKEEQTVAAPPAPDVDPIRVAPKGPKADLNPVGARAKPGPPFPRHSNANIAASPRLYDNHQDAQTAQSPLVSRFGGPARPGSSHGPHASNQSRGTFSSQWISPQITTKANQTVAGLPVQPASGPEQATRQGQGEQNPPTAPSAGIAGLARRPPTGPKAQPSIRAPMAHRGGYQRTTTWASNVPRAPSIMNNMPSAMVPAKRDISGEERTNPFRARSLDQEPQLSPRKFLALSSASEPMSDGLPVDDRKVLDTDGREVPSARSMSESASHLLPVKSIAQDDNVSDEDDYDDNMDLDEEDFEGAEKIFCKELENLKAKRPPSPKHHPEVLLLLDEIDALASAAEDLRNGYIPPPTEAATLATDVPIGLPSPVSRVAEARKDLEDTVKLEITSTSAELPLNGLPYLVSGIPTPLSQAASVQEDSERFEMISARIRERLVREKEEQERDDEEARQEYARLYGPWRSKIEAMEQDKREVEENRAVTPAPPVVPEPPPPVAPAPTPEGGRRNRAFGTELDLQQALAASKITAEEEFNREREAQENDEKPDMTKEAVIPEMLSKSETSTTFFKDTNNFIENDLVLETFGFVPPEDDFTAEEQVKFIEGYITTPKKWGHIAYHIQGRDYQDCIRHYYLTKRDTPYKLELNKMTGKRGRRTGTRGRPRNATGLLGSLNNGVPLGTDHYAQQVLTTETGRPRRAAAPTGFSEKDKKDSEATGPKPSARAKGAASIKSTGEVSEAATEKVTAKRGRQAQPKERGPKRGGKAQQLLAPNPSPAKEKPDGERAKSKEPKIEDALRRDMEGAQMLAGLHSSQPAPVSAPAPIPAIPQVGHTETWPFTSQAQTPVPAPEPRATQPPKLPPKEQPTKEQPAIVPSPKVPLQSVTIAQPAAPSTTSKPTTSSYWSVPEQQEFQTLVAHYGTDWQSIAGALKTKSQVMVKNYYNRQIVEKPELEHLARTVDERTKRQGPPGTPPVTHHNKRKGDSSAQNVPQRPLAPNTEGLDAETDASQPSSNVPAQPSPTQFGQHQSRLPLLRQAPAPTTATPTQISIPQDQVPPSIWQQQPLQAQRPSSQQTQGPRIGFFNDAERPAHPVHAPPPVPLPRREIRERQAVEREQPQPGQVLGKQQFEELLNKQHARKEETKQQIPPYSAPVQQRPHPAPIQQQPVVQKPEPFPPSRAPPTIMPHVETDRGSRLSIYPPQRPAEPSPPINRRQEPYPGSTAYPQPPSHSPIHPRPSPKHTQLEVARPGSVPISTLSQPVAPPLPPPPPPAPAPAKRSNLMSLLNDEPSEPQPRKTPVDTRSHVETRPPPPPPRHQSPATPNPLYQQPSQPAPYARRDPIMEAMPQHQSTPLRHSYSQQGYQSQPQQQVQPPPQAQPQQPPQQVKEPGGWSSSRSSFHDQRHVYQSTAGSPQTQPTYLQPARPSYQSQAAQQDSQTHTSRLSYSSQPAHVESQAQVPAPHAHAHSRASSFTNLHPHVPQPAGQSLAPSPYASIQPPSHRQQPLQPHPAAPPPSQNPLHQSISHSHSHSHSQPIPPPPQQRSASAFPISSMQQHEHAPRRQDERSLRMEQDRRSHDMRPQSHREELWRDEMRREAEMRQQVQQQQQQQHQVHQQQQQQQQEDMRMYTPPIYSRQYQPPPPPPPPSGSAPPQGQGDGRYERRYDERR